MKMMRTRKFVPLATIIGGFLILFIDGMHDIAFTVNEGMFTAVMYAGLGSSAVVGGVTAWTKGKKKE